MVPLLPSNIADIRGSHVERSCDFIKVDMTRKL